MVNIYKPFYETTNKEMNTKETYSNGMFAIMVENEDGEYEEYNGSSWPSSDDYILNKSKSECFDKSGNLVENDILDYNNGVVTVLTTTTTFCNLYFKLDTSVYHKIKKEGTLDSSTKDNEYPIYYYPGTSTNNNVIFGVYCWKMVISTDTGGVKLLYNGKPKNGTCDNTGEDSTIGTSLYNSNYTSPADVGYMYNTRYASSIKTYAFSNNYLYGNSFTYKYGTYTLTDTIIPSTYTEIGSNHYTCFNTTGTCSSVYYIYLVADNISNSTDISEYYITLENGKSVSDALEEMLYANDVNKTDSTIKAVIDNWYKENMTDYTSWLENTIWCSNREISLFGGWDPYSEENSILSFNKSSRTCSNQTDQFTLSVESGGIDGYGNNALTYPVALLNYYEANKAYASGGYLKINSYYWLLSPNMISSGQAFEVRVDKGGSTGGSYMPVNQEYGVRPAVSLKSDIKITSGDGSVLDPYLLEYNS